MQPNSITCSSHLKGVGQEMAWTSAGMARAHSGGVKGPLHKRSRRVAAGFKMMQQARAQPAIAFSVFWHTCDLSVNLCAHHSSEPSFFLMQTVCGQPSRE